MRVGRHLVRLCYHACNLDITHQLAVFTADHDVIAVTGNNMVAAAMVRIGREYPVDIQCIAVVTRQGTGQRRRRIRIEPARIRRRPVNVARITNDNVVTVRTQTIGVFTVVRRDGIRIDAAQDDVAAHARRDRIRTAYQGINRLHQAQCNRLTAELGAIGFGCRDPAVVAKHDVVALARIDRVAVMTVCGNTPGSSKDTGYIICADHLAILTTEDDVITGTGSDSIVSALAGIS